MHGPPLVSYETLNSITRSRNPFPCPNSQFISQSDEHPPALLPLISHLIRFDRFSLSHVDPGFQLQQRCRQPSQSPNACATSSPYRTSRISKHVFHIVFNPIDLPIFRSRPHMRPLQALTSTDIPQPSAFVFAFDPSVVVRLSNEHWSGHFHRTTPPNDTNDSKPPLSLRRRKVPK